MRTYRLFLSLAASAALLMTGLACEKKLSEEAVAAQEAAKTADARVAALEQQLAEIKAGKAQQGSSDREASDHVSKSQQKALERQLADAKRRADEKRKDAVNLAAAPKPAEAPKPVIVDVPAGTKVTVKLAKELNTKDDQAGDAWAGTLSEAIAVGGKTVWPAGTDVRGVVSESTPTGRLSSGKGGLGIKLTAIGKEQVDGGTYVMVGDKRGARNAKFIGGGAALGALAGILSDNKNKNDHALGGAAIGAAAGTALAAGTADTVIRIPAETPVTFTLNAPERIILKH